MSSELTNYANQLPMPKLYDAMGAVRGPDDGDLRLYKATVVARVRHILFPRAVFGAAYQHEPLTEKDVDWLIDSSVGRVVSPHLLSHLHAAIRATADHPVWGPPQTRQRLMTFLARGV